ncbi:MAG: carboxypeptidase-like regulatory domain-containing protein [Flavobacterium sp.]|nr:carboxypeptidase-like regulatory domain-containing protein [Candidatus Neoflavobacterium equi]
MKRLYKIGCCICFLAFPFQNDIHSQEVYVQVLDSLSRPIPDARILVLVKDEVKFTHYTNANGQLSFVLPPHKQYTVVCSALEFETQTRKITTDSKKILSLHYVLQRKVQQLEEVLITQAITQKGDTLKYNVAHFKEGNERVLEELLKKIPNISVDELGGIKVGNKSIEAILLDGEDLLEKGYKILSKNLPASQIEQVQVLYKFSNNKQLKDIEQSDKVALNLVFDEAAKSSWFGNTTAANNLLAAERYDLRANALRFNKTNKFYGLANFNTVGYRAVSDLSSIFASSNSYAESQSANIPNLIHVTPNTPQIKDDRINFNNDKLLSFNNSYTINPKNRIKIISIWNTDRNQFYSDSRYHFDDGVEQFSNTENHQVHKAANNTTLKIDWVSDLSKNTEFNITATQHNDNQKDRGRLVFNQFQTAEDLQSKTAHTSFQFLITSKVSKTTVWQFSGNYTHQNNVQEYLMQPNVYDSTAQPLLQNLATQISYTGFQAMAYKKINTNHLLEWTTQINLQSQRLQSALNYQPMQDHVVTLPWTALQWNENSLMLHQNKYTSLLHHTYSWSNYSISTGINTSLLQQRETVSNNQKQWINLQPNLKFLWNINRISELQLTYQRFNQSLPIHEMYAAPIHIAFRNFISGRHSLNQFQNQNARFNYEYGKISNRFFMNFQTGINLENQYPALSMTTTTDRTWSQIVLRKNRQLYFVNNAYNYYISKIKSNVKLQWGWNKNRYENCINTLGWRKVNQEVVQYGMEYQSGFSSAVQFSLASNWQQVKYQAQTSNQYTNNRSSLQINWEIYKSNKLQLITDYYHFGNITNAPKNYVFTDLQYHIKLNDKVQYSTILYNLFNTDKFVNYHLTDLSSSETQYQLLGRYLLLRLDIDL